MITYPTPPFQVPYPQAALQSEVDFQFQAPAPGSLYDAAEVREILSGICQSYVPFSCFVAKDISAGDPNAVKIPTQSTDITANPGGVAVKTGAIETRRDLLPPGYPAQRPLNYMRVGRIWVTTEDAVAENGDVYVRFTAGSGDTAAFTQLGALRSDSDGGKAAKITGAKFKKATSVLGELTFVELNLLAQ